MVRVCCAVMCSHDNRTCKMKVFPADKKRADVWQMNIGRANWERGRNSSVCECHFDETQYESPTPDEYGRRKLRGDAVPLIFPTHVLVVHNPDADQKWHSPVIADSQAESREPSSLRSQEVKVEPEHQPAKHTKPMPRSVKVKMESRSQLAKPIKSLSRSLKVKTHPEPPPAKPTKSLPRSLRVKLEPNPQPETPTKPKLRSQKAKTEQEPQPAKPTPRNPKAKTGQKLSQTTQPSPVTPKPQPVKFVKPMPKCVKAKRDLRLSQRAKPKSAQPAVPWPKSSKAKKKLESPIPTEPQQPAHESETSRNLSSISLDHDYGQKSLDSKMCEEFCTIEVMEEIENQVLHASDKNSVNQRLQDGSSEMANDSTDSGPDSHETISRIIINPASKAFINPACVATQGSSFHKTVSPTFNSIEHNKHHAVRDIVVETESNTSARVTRSMKADTISNGDISSRNVIDDPSDSICNGIAKTEELLQLTKDAKSTVYRLGIKRKSQSSPSNRPSKLLKTSASPSSSKSLLRVPGSPRMSSPPRKSSVSSKDVATETEAVPTPNPPVSTKDVATETAPLSPPRQRPSVSSHDVATETEPMSPPKPPPLQFQPPEVWNTSDENLALGSPALLSDAVSFLQFMLPQKWMALAENTGIHVVLLSGKSAKAIQRSVFVPFSGKGIELHVHAMKLSNNSSLFGGTRLETRPLTTESLGDFVDGVVRIVQVFNSYKICCGVAKEEFMEQWRNFHDCILDRNLFGEESYTQTVRSTDCRYLAPKDSERCLECGIL